MTLIELDIDGLALIEILKDDIDIDRGGEKERSHYAIGPDAPQYVGALMIGSCRGGLAGWLTALAMTTVMFALWSLHFFSFFTNFILMRNQMHFTALQLLLFVHPVNHVRPRLT